MAVADVPLGDVFPESPFVDWFNGWFGSVEFRSRFAQLRLGGPMEGVGVGEMSMGSRGGASMELEDGRMGIDLCRLELCGSGEKGLRRASATEAMAGG